MRFMSIVVEFALCMGVVHFAHPLENAWPLYLCVMGIAATNFIQGTLSE